MNLALFEHSNGQTRQALSYIRHAYNNWRIISGDGHPDAITTMNNIAVMLQSLKEYTSSLAWFQASVDICESIYGKESINTATLYFQVAQACALTGAHKESINKMRDSYAIFKKELGPDDKNTKETEYWLSQLTQSAVNLAKQAKLDATRRARQIGGGPGGAGGVAIGGSASALGRRVVSAPIVQQQASVADAVKTTTSIGSKGTQSIEELVKYISGETPAPQKKKVQKKRQGLK